MLFLLIKKKPSWLTVSAAILCLCSCFILTGMLSDGAKIYPLGDTLCSLSGVFYGINIAITSVYAKKFFVSLYLAIQLFTEAILSFALAITLNFTNIETIKFSLDIRLILLNIVFVLVSLTLGWLIRTWAMQFVDPSVVAVMMPFSAIVTVVASIIIKTDEYSHTLLIGAVLGLAAIFLCGFGDREPKAKKE